LAHIFKQIFLPGGFYVPPQHIKVIYLRRFHLLAFLSTLAGLLILYCLWLAKPFLQIAIHTGSTLDGYVIVIDPGHGGRDAGSSHAGVYEKDITLAVSMVIAQEIQSRGGTVVLTRTTDTDLWDMVTYEEEIAFTKKEYVLDQQLGRPIDPRDQGIALQTRFPPTYRLGLRARLLVAAQHNAHLFISIHTNHYRSESAKGAVTLYQPHSPESQQLAMTIQRHLKQLLPGRAEPGIIPDNFFILRRSEIPTVLVEIGFVSNEHDRTMMLSASGQHAIAEAIVNGIEDYLSSKTSSANY